MQPRRAIRGSAVLFCLLGAGASCTFGAIADYEVQECTPAATQADDVCNRLDPSATCDPFQCDAATKHCVRRARDDDRDGDPAESCGGGDCGDVNPNNRSGSVESCDGFDNTCDGIVDEEVVVASPTANDLKTGALTSTADVTFASNNGEYVVAGLTVPRIGGGTCVQAVRTPGGKPEFLYAGCSFLADPSESLEPRQPYVQLAGSGAAVLFVPTSGCKQGRLAFRYSSSGSGGGKAELTCNELVTGAALPALALFSDNETTGIGLYYDVALPARDNLDDCGAASPAPLRALLVSGTSTATPAFTKSEERTLSADSISIRPPGVAPVKGSDLVLVAAPSGSNVAVWPIARGDLQAGGSVPPSAPIPDLAGARGAAIATSKSGAVAVAAEIGCPGGQSVRLALGAIDVAAKSLSFDKNAEVAPSAPLATQPAVAWNEKLGEWLVSWVESGGLLRARRFTAEGVAIGGAIEVTSSASAGAPASDGKLYAFSTASGDSRFSAYALGCK